jgi:signal transduction histidine kinase
VRIFRPDPAHPFQFAKFVSLSSFLLILSTALLLSVFMSNYAREVLLKKNSDFALLLAENLNHQIFQRFTLPTIIGFGRVELKNKDQYERLDQVVKSTIHSFHVLEVKIFNNSGEVSYASNKKFLGEKLLSNLEVERAVEKREHFFILEKKISNLRAMFKLDFEPRTVVLRTIYPLKAERTFGLKKEPIMGILEFKQDISKDFETIVYFQWLIIAVFFSSFLVLYVLLRLIIKRAESLLLERLKEKEKLETELHRTEKLVSMGRMVSGIAHEIRNPLGIIQSTSEFLYQRFSKEDKAESKLIKAVYEEAKRLGKTVNDFLDYARPVEPRQELVDLKQIFEEIKGFLQGELEKKKVTLELEGESIYIEGDKHLLYRAFYNLILNSFQAVEEKGWIKVKFLASEKTIEILDSGPGFEPALLEKYLEPFFTTKDSGTGLGLAIVKNILEGHRASMLLDNHSQGGRIILKF